MCLYVKSKPEIAKEDIVCFKIVENHVKYWRPGVYAYKDEYLYPYNNVLTAESYIHGEKHSIQHLKIRCLANIYMIDEGFHARCNKTRNCTNICVIPKGTEYCLGNDNDIVAVNMIVFRTILDYCWYRIKKLLKE